MAVSKVNEYLLEKYIKGYERVVVEAILLESSKPKLILVHEKSGDLSGVKKFVVALDAVLENCLLYNPVVTGNTRGSITNTKALRWLYPIARKTEWLKTELGASVAVEEGKPNGTLILNIPANHCIPVKFLKGLMEGVIEHAETNHLYPMVFENIIVVYRETSYQIEKLGYTAKVTLVTDEQYKHVFNCGV